MAIYDDVDLLPNLFDSVLRRLGAQDWTVRPRDFWTHVDPPSAELGLQGWKLHVSATPLSASLVLLAAAEVLVDETASFKFAGTLARLADQTSARAERSGGGKFITVYPRDGEHFRRLAERLHTATSGLPGPGILSDRQYRPGSLVYYRYGVFAGTNVLTNDGSFDVMLTDPDGKLAKDQRKPWFTPPAWAPAPFPGTEPPAPAGSGTAVLLNDRYLVRRAIRHAYKGGVYLGVDQRDGTEVIIKEARRNVGAGLDGEDVRAALRYEAQVLDQFAPLDVAAKGLESFIQGGNVFLVQELVPGMTLRDWVADNDPLTIASVLDLLGQLTEILRRVHGAAFVLRDFTPNNVMVTPDGKLRLIDLEMTTRPGEQVTKAYTPGFAAPEVLAAPRTGPAPEQISDLYSLGAIVVYLLSGQTAALLRDEPESRPHSEQLRLFIDAAFTGNAVAPAFAPLLDGLLDAEPRRRWTLDRVDAFVAALRAAPPVPGSAPGEPRLEPHDQDKMLDDGLAYLAETMNTGKPQLWRQTGFGANADAVNVQYGAGGVLAVFARAAVDPLWAEATQRIAGWIRARLADGNPTLPGLYFGRSGTGTALLDAGRALGDAGLADAALDLLRRVPVSWPNPDVCHGAAGAGLAFLHAYAATADRDFLARAETVAAELLASAERQDGGLLWTIPATFASELAGLRHYGYAHGVAGIGTFLLLAGQATGREDFLASARDAGTTLVRAARSDDDGGAAWPVSEGKADVRSQVAWWCSGAAGVGTFLVRLWRATGDPHLLDLAERAAVAVRRQRRLSPAACHGLSGNAELLLDLAAATGNHAYRRWAEELAGHIHARHAVRNGRIVVPDESMAGVTAAYNTGLAGALGLLLRLRDGGTRLFVPDDLVLPARSAALVSA